MKEMNPATTHIRMKSLVKETEALQKGLNARKSALHRVNAFMCKAGESLKDTYSISGYVSAYKDYDFTLCLYLHKSPANVVRDIALAGIMDALELPADYKVLEKSVDTGSARGSFIYDRIKIVLTVLPNTDCKVTYITKTYEEAVYTC